MGTLAVCPVLVQFHHLACGTVASGKFSIPSPLANTLFRAGLLGAWPVDVIPLLVGDGVLVLEKAYV